MLLLLTLLACDPAAPADSKTTLANRAATISDQLRLFKNDTTQATR
jgi:hypothetical protein